MLKKTIRAMLESFFFSLGARKQRVSFFRSKNKVGNEKNLLVHSKSLFLGRLKIF